MCRKAKLLLASFLLATAGTVSGVAALVPDPVAVPANARSASPSDYGETIEAMRPPKRSRPIVAVLGDNRGTEAIDFLVPYGVLKQSGAADVFAVGMTSGKLQLRPALAIEPQMTVSELDARFPAGADYVVVPAMTDHEDPKVSAWIRSQSAKGAIIVAVCAGAEILAHGGLLKDRKATTHWASVATMLKAEPAVQWQPHRRYVADRGVITTTGVSAAMPMSIALVEAIAGRERAEVLARDLGVGSWTTIHDSGAYRLGNAFWTGIRNKMAEWGLQELGIPVSNGVNEIGLALASDAWSRTYRSQAVTVASARTIRTRHGLTLYVDLHSRKGLTAMLQPIEDNRPALLLDRTFDQISARYGVDTMKLVAVQLEHERGASK